MMSRSPISFVVRVVVVGFILLCCLDSPGAEAPTKSLVPGDAVQQQAKQLIDDVYGKEIAAADTPDRMRALAQKILKTAAESKEDLAGQYVLLREAGRLAMKAGDLPTAIDAVDRMDALFFIDASSMKLALVGSATKRIATPAAGKALAGIALEVADDAVGRDNFDAARQAAAMATTAAGKTRDPAILRSVKEHKKRLEQMAAAYEEVRHAIAALEKNPADTPSNLAVGRYRVLQGNWEEALRLLVLGGDKGLADIAAADAAGASGADAQVKLGDGWWALAEKEGALLKDKMRRRAVSWYEQALPGLAGLSKARVEKRIAEVPAQGDVKPSDAAKLRRGTKIYLDDLKEAEAVIRWMSLGKHGELGKPGEKMWFRGVNPAHALATHPPSKGSSTVTYDLNGEYSAFSAIAGMWAPAQEWTGQSVTPVVFRVWCDDKLAWESRPLQKHNDGQACMVPLRRVKRLKLEVFCSGAFEHAFAGWIDPCVIK
jgi:hypothetical protein